MLGIEFSLCNMGAHNTATVRTVVTIIRCVNNVCWDVINLRLFHLIVWFQGQVNVLMHDFMLGRKKKCIGKKIEKRFVK